MSKISIGKLFLIIIISFFSNLSYSQYSKGVDKLLNLHRTKPDVALKKMQKFVEKKGRPNDWNLYVNMHHYRYRVAKDSLKNEALTEQYFFEFINTCKIATLKSSLIDASNLSSINKTKLTV